MSVQQLCFHGSRCLLVTLCALGTMSSWAVSLPNQEQQKAQTFEQCLGLPDAQRLACYDRVALQAAKHSDTSLTTVDSEQTASTSSTIDVQFTSEIEDIDSTVALAQAERSDETLPSATPMEQMWELSDGTQRPMFSLQSYHTNYVLFAQHSDRVNRLPESPSPNHQVRESTDYRHTESKFQLSVRSKLVQDLFKEHDSIWFGYTQVSQWQVWSPNISRPFRATSYKPEVMYVMPTQYALGHTGWTWRMAGLGLIHESNGQSDPLSRSWNRAYLRLGLDSGNMSLYARFWKRFPESRSDDDNPDITTYMGRADFRLNWDLKHDNTLGVTWVTNLRSSSKGSVQLDYYFPLSYLWGAGDYLRGYVQVFHGYGDTITDYNFRRTALGIGVALKEW